VIEGERECVCKKIEQLVGLSLWNQKARPFLKKGKSKLLTQ